MSTVSATYPGLPVSVPSARRLVCDILTASPRVGDIELIAAELVTNAIQHSSAGEPGGVFTLTIHRGSSWACIEVTDAGGAAWQAEPDSNVDAEYGRGLVIIAEVADRFGHDDDAYGRTVWAEVSW